MRFCRALKAGCECLARSWRPPFLSDISSLSVLRSHLTSAVSVSSVPIQHQQSQRPPFLSDIDSLSVLRSYPKSAVPASSVPIRHRQSQCPPFLSRSCGQSVIRSYPTGRPQCPPFLSRSGGHSVLRSYPAVAATVSSSVPIRQAAAQGRPGGVRAVSSTGLLRLPNTPAGAQTPRRQLGRARGCTPDRAG